MHVVAPEQNANDEGGRSQGTTLGTLADSKVLGNGGLWVILLSFARHRILQRALEVSSNGNNKAIGTF